MTTHTQGVNHNCILSPIVACRFSYIPIKAYISLVILHTKYPFIPPRLHSRYVIFAYVFNDLIISSFQLFQKLSRFAQKHGDGFEAQAGVATS